MSGEGLLQMSEGKLSKGVSGLFDRIRSGVYSVLFIWNRSPSKYPPIKQAGTTIASTPSNVLENSDFIFSMLFDGLTRSLRGKTLINTASVPVACNLSLAKQVHTAGGSFLEIPVSGSRGPAEQGTLIGMLAGNAEVSESIRPIIQPITRAAIYCGGIGQGLRMKYAVSFTGLDTQAFGQVLNAGPMASEYSRHKVQKMLSGDWTAEATVRYCYNLTQLIKSASEEVDTWSPIIELVGELYLGTKEMGLEGEDLSALTKIFSRLK
ncbi:NAD(P)-dependent oxidoreductase [Aspergillus undulatus]|uniref:NAD(P)-dependent oxidoreductase n=1 Tax=Aspergillus undulatus TaxID=1810928 RepID=UPI003CCE517E